MVTERLSFTEKVLGLVGLLLIGLIGWASERPPRRALRSTRASCGRARGDGRLVVDRLPHSHYQRTRGGAGPLQEQPGRSDSAAVFASQIELLEGTGTSTLIDRVTSGCIRSQGSPPPVSLAVLARVEPEETRMNEAPAKETLGFQAEVTNSST